MFNRFLTESQAHQEVSLWEAGRERIIDLRISPLKGENGLTSGRIVIWRDLTENRQKDETLRRQLDELTLLSQAISLTASSKDITSALQKVCAAAARYFQSPQAAVAVLDQKCTAAEVIAEYCAPSRPSAIGIKIPAAENPSIAYILEHKSPLAI